MKQHIKTSVQQGIGVAGVVTVAVLEPKTYKEEGLLIRMRKNIEKLKTAKGIHKTILFDENKKIQDLLENSCLVRRFVQNNIVTTVGLGQVVKGLSSNLAGVSDLAVNYTAVGTGTTTPAAADTTLTTESFRNVVNTLNYAGGVLFASMFIDYTEDSGTYKEAGLFINGSGAADSGSMLDHVLLNAPTGIVKSVSQIVTISFQLTFTPV